MCPQKTARGGELFVGNAFCDQFHAAVNSKMAAGKHQIIAFWMSPDGVSVEIKMTFSHTVNFMDSFSGLSLTDLVPGHDTLYTGFLVCINENRNHMFPTGQDRGSASAHNDTAAFLGNFQNGFPLNIKSDLAFWIERMSHGDSVRKWIAGQQVVDGQRPLSIRI